MSTDPAHFKQHVHYNRNLEGALLGACLLEKNAYGRIHGYLQPQCFYDDNHKQIYTTIQQMWQDDSDIDIFTLVPRLVKAGMKYLPDDQIALFVTQLTNAVVSTAHLETHALLIRQCYCERELLRIHQSAPSMSGDALDKIHSLEAELQRLRMISVTNDWSDTTDLMVKVSTHMTEVEGRQLIGVTTGFSLPDLITGGFCNTNLIIIAARPSVGKSALLNKMAMTQAMDGDPVGIISLEMPKVQIGARMLAMEAGMDFYKIFRNKLTDEKERDRMMEAMGRMTKLPIFISDKTGVSVHDIKAKAAQLIYKKKLKILYIDYLQLIEGVRADEKRNFNREQEVSKMTRALKHLAMDFDIPVVALAQLNRETERNEGKKPQLHNLRESGAIEQDADGVIFIHRDWKVGITENPTDGHSTEREADFMIAKWRNGELGDFKIGWEPGRMEFFDPQQANNPQPRIAAPKHLPEPLEHWRKPYIEGF